MLLRGLMVAALLLLASPAGAAGRLEAVDSQSFKHSEFRLPFFYPTYRWTLTASAYVPERISSGDTVTLLHGCTQTAKEYLDKSGWRELADEKGIALLLVEFKDDFNNCFWWSEKADVHGGVAVQAKFINDSVGKLRTKLKLPSGANHLTGLSAGAAMTVAVLALHPETFESGAAIAGIPYSCAQLNKNGVTSIERPGKSTMVCTPQIMFDDLEDACGCMAGKATHLSGKTLAAAIPAAGGAKPRLSVWQGTADDTVKCGNARETAAQWTSLWGERELSGDCQHGSHDFVGPPEKKTVELRIIPGLNHAVPTAPGQSGCGIDDGLHFSAVGGVCSTREIAAFFGLGR